MRARCRSGGDLRNAGSSRPGDGRGETAPVAMQSRVQLLVEEAHARAAASWHRLQVAPEDLARFAGSWSAAWESGDGLRAITYALVLLLVGGGVEWLYWCYAGRVLRAIAETVMAVGDDTALAPGRAAALSGRRGLLEACGCALFAVSTVVASAAFTWPAEVQEAVVGFTFLVTATRLTDIAVRALLAPHCSRLRLLPLDDAATRRVRRIAVGLAAIAAGGSSLRSLCDGPLAAPALGFAVSLVAGLGICGFALDGIRLWSFRLNASEHRRAVSAASAVLPFLGAAAAVAGVAFTLLGAPQFASGIMIGFAAVVAARTIRALIDVFAAEPEAGTQADAACRPSAYRPVLRRMALLIVIGAALVGLAGEWAVSMQDLWQSEGVGRLLGRGLEVTIVVLLADLAWLWARTAIDRRVVVPGARPPEARSGEPSDPATRLATLFPLLRKAVMIVIVAAAALISLSSFGIDIAPLLAGAGVIGVAIGFGTQTLVRDIVSGIFYLLEDAFRVGEYVEFGQIRSTVESISLRFLRLRHHRGAVHTIPFGEIRWLTNQSRDWQIMKLEFRVPFDTDVRLVKSLVKRIGEELMQDAELGPWLLEPVKSRGVIRMEEFCMVIGVKFTARPGDGQFMVRREAYHRILDAFAANGICFSHRHVKVEMIGDKPEEPLIPALAGGASELPIEPPLALVSPEQGSG
jgi:small-conductance mechanosensitive channel